MNQDVLIYALLAMALAFLAYRFFGRKKKDDCDKCG